MKVEYINPFIEASQTVLKQMAGIDASLGKIFLKNSPSNSDSIVIIVGLTGKMRGQAIFTMNSTTALDIASNMMGGMALEKLDEISKSAISELTNMILGNAATILYNNGVGVEITPPTLLSGDNIQVSYNKTKVVCIPLNYGEDKTIEIDIALEDN